MSIESFKKEVWETALITAFRGISVTELITTPPSRVEGTKAIFNKISGGTIKDYTGTVDYDEAVTTPVELLYDKKKYWALAIDDVDKVQAAGPVLMPLAQEKAYDLKEVIDTDVLKEIAKIPTASNKQLLGTSSAKVEITDAAMAYDKIVDLNTILDKKKVPKNNRFILASSEYINLMAKDKRFVDNLNVLPNGIVQGATVNGSQVISCEEVPAGTVLAVHKSCFGYGSQLQETEALRLQSSFSDAVRGLQVYGRTPLREEAVSAMLYQLV